MGSTSLAHGVRMRASDTLERALQLAADGRHRSIGEIRKSLTREKFDRVEEHLVGPAFQAQLKAIIAKATR